MTSVSFMSLNDGSQILRQVPLTSGSPTGAQVFADTETRDRLSLVKDDKGRHVLLVSKSHANDHYVTSFSARLVRSGLTYRTELVDLATVKDSYLDGTEDRKADVELSKAQAYAKRTSEEAASRHASDIRYRVNKTKTDIHFVIHRNLFHYKEESVEFGKQLLAAIYGAMTDVSDATYEALSRQDARISDPTKLPPGIDGIRVATTPQVDGQVMVLRLLYNDAGESNDVESLGFTSEQAALLKSALKRPTGLNIFCGPTGTGKSTTLQRLFIWFTNFLASMGIEKNIITVEDPPEYNMPGIIQTPVTGTRSSDSLSSEAERSIAFQDAIRAVLRLAPELLLIGEIRDLPTAILAMRAAMTGHPTWSTLHCNSALAGITRLLDLGITKDILLDEQNLTSLSSQRLVPRLCECKLPLDIRTASRYAAEDIKRIRDSIQSETIFVHGPGCPKCASGPSALLGRSGRRAVAETILCDEGLMRAFRKDGRAGGTAYWREEMRGKSIKDHAADVVAAGLVDPFDAEAVVGEFTSSPLARCA